MAAEKWNFDIAHSSVGFSVRHLMISKVHGNFKQWAGHIVFDPANLSASSVEAQIEVASIDTKEAQRDGHLKSPDFFDAEKYPQMTFKSTSVEGSGESFDVKGDLTIHGVTKPVTLKVEYAGRVMHPMAKVERAGFSAHTTINRKDFGLAWNAALETGGVVLSEKVEITLEIQGMLA